MESQPEREIPLPERRYRHDQIIGLRVITTAGEFIGTVSDIISGQSNDNYIVKTAKGDVLIPAIEDVVLSIDPGAGQIIIEPIEGLLDLNEKKPRER